MQETSAQLAEGIRDIGWRTNCSECLGNTLEVPKSFQRAGNKQ